MREIIAEQQNVAATFRWAAGRGVQQESRTAVRLLPAQAADDATALQVVLPSPGLRAAE
jgi:hypothetical protein